MAIAIGIYANEKTFESDERRECFSLETKGKKIMKPTIITKNSARKFPFVDFQYQPSRLGDLTGHCAKTPSKSLRDISREYFDKEDNTDFVSNAAIFFAMLASALIPIAAGASEVIHLVRVLPGF